MSGMDLPCEHSDRDDVERFAALCAESRHLLDDARSLVAEMRAAIEQCKRYRPVVETAPAEGGDSGLPPPIKTHRGGRIVKRVRRIPRRPR